LVRNRPYPAKPRYRMLMRPARNARMPRSPRLDLPGVAQHVVQRGNDRQPCFFTADDYLRYLRDLNEIARREGCAIHAYVPMTNHVHLLVTPPGTGRVSRMMQALGRRYVRYVNQTYHRTGTLWEGRYKACLVASDAHLLQCHRYIELNPLRAAMVLS
jgi:putative transposase